MLYLGPYATFPETLYIRKRERIKELSHNFYSVSESEKVIDLLEILDHVSVSIGSFISFSLLHCSCVLAMI